MSGFHLVRPDIENVDSRKIKESRIRGIALAIASRQTRDDPADLRGTSSSVWPGLATVVAGAILIDGAVLTAAYRRVSPTADEQLSFPWDGATAVATSALWGAAQLLLVWGLVAFARSGAVVSRSGRIGQAIAIAGSSLFVLAHLLSAIEHDALIDESDAIAPLACFGVGTVLLAVGMILAGVGTLRAAEWTGWRRFTPIALGIWMFAVMPLQFTSALAAAVAIYGIAVLALGAALVEEAR